MPSAEIIAIGSELLLGETQDTNTQFLLRMLRDRGINVYRTLIIGDNSKKISAVIKEAFTRSDIVITTGGLGPTIDDPTREAAALAFNCKLVFDETLWQSILKYFEKMQRKSTENNKRQAFIPEIASPIPNPVGTAPAFYIFHNSKLLISLPGVPHEMKYLTTEFVIALLKKFFPENETILVRTLHSYGLGESVIDELVGDLEESSNPTLGLSAKLGQIDLRITAKGRTHSETKKLISDFENTIRKRLGINIFGSDEETLSSVTNRLLSEKNIKLCLLEINSNGSLSKLLAQDLIVSVNIMSETPENVESSDFIDQFLSSSECAYTVVCMNCLNLTNNFVHTDIFFKTPAELIHLERSYNGLTFSEEQSVLFALETIRETVLSE
ncbi:MAG: competence/damage-inducible protein A [Flexilinea sp.]